LNKILQLRKKGRLMEVQTTNEMLMLQEETVIHFRLFKDAELSEALLNEIHAFDGYAKGLEKAYHYLSFKPRSVAQMKEYLQQKEIGAVDRILTELKSKGYLNDEQTARLIADQVLAQAKGKKVIRQKLIEAKIHPSIIDLVVGESTVEPQDVDRRLRSYLKPTTKSKRAFQASLMQKMMSAGFSYDLIQQSMQDHHDEIDACVDERKGISLFMMKHPSFSKDGLIKKLLAQGYPYGLIEQVLREERHEH
jgi:regulatory protein